MAQDFEELWTLFLEGGLDEAGVASLQELLASDSELLQLACDLYEEHRLVGFVLQPFDDLQFVKDAVANVETDNQQFVSGIISGLQREPMTLGSVAARKATPHKYNAYAVGSVRERVWQRSFLAVAMAVSVLLGGLAWFFANRADELTGGKLVTESSIDSAERVRYIATVLFEDNCSWASSDSPREGQRLSARTIDLKSGLAVIRFDGGAELILQDDTELQLLSAGMVKVNHGNIVVRAIDSAVGFRVITPASEVIDLGTEFSVKVSERGETELEVLEGEVSVRPLGVHSGRVQVLTEGNSVVVDDADSEPRNTELQAERFDALIAKARPKSRADLMYAYDGFFYDEGELPLKQSTRGKGWAGPWRKRTVAEGAKGEPDTGTNDALQIVHGQMNVTWPVPGGRLGMLQFPPGKSYRVREMRRSIDLGRDGIYYFSLMVRESNLSGRPPQTRPQESMRLTFRSEEAYFDESLSFQISSKRTPQIRTGLGVGFASAAESSPDQTTLWIGKIVARENGEDEVSFRVFAESDELTYAEPAVWHVVSRNLDLSAKLNLVLLTSTGSAPRIVDELRIGPTWRSVTPMLERSVK